MSATAITAVTTPYADYSRYGATPAEYQIPVRFLPAAPAAGDAFTVALERRDGWGAVATKPYIWTGAEPNGVATVTFDLRQDCTDAQGLYHAIQGDYQATATLVANAAVTGATPPFTVSIVGVREMRQTWLYGMHFLASEVKQPKDQPRLVTGVTVTEVSQDHKNNPYPLVYTPAAGAPPPVAPVPGLAPGLVTSYTLSWAGGVPVYLVPGVPQEYMLIDAFGQDWIRVAVDPLLLPAVPATEYLVIEQAKYKDEDIIRQVRLATGWLEGTVLVGNLPLEPRYLATEWPIPAAAQVAAPPPMADEILPTSPLNRPDILGGQWLEVKFNRRGVQSIDYLLGYMNRTQVVMVPVQNWVILSPKAGRADLIPSSGSTINYQLYGLPFFAFLQAYSTVPNFWHYAGYFGMKDLFGPNAVAREAIAKKAAIEICIEAGSAYRAGVSSESISRDGVSKSTGYTNSAMYGTYAHVTIPMQQWLDANLPGIKTRFLGVRMLTIQ